MPLYEPEIVDISVPIRKEYMFIPSSRANTQLTRKVRKATFEARETNPSIQFFAVMEGKKRKGIRAQTDIVNRVIGTTNVSAPVTTGPSQTSRDRRDKILKYLEMNYPSMPVDDCTRFQIQRMAGWRGTQETLRRMVARKLVEYVREQKTDYFKLLAAGKDSGVELVSEKERITDEVQPDVDRILTDWEE